jgi:hypothetical protein
LATEGSYPNDFSSLTDLKERLLGFQERYQQIASPFQRSFTRRDLVALLAKLKQKGLGRVA